jgi:predicted ester cyclase
LNIHFSRVITRIVTNDLEKYESYEIKFWNSQVLFCPNFGKFNYKNFLSCTEVSKPINIKEKSVESTTEANKEVFRRLIEGAWNQGNLNVIEECFSTNLAKVARQNVPIFRAAFPDIHVTVEDQVAEGELVATRFTARGTHKGEFRRISPTGTKITVTGISIDRVVNGKIVEEWTHLVDDYKTY